MERLVDFSQAARTRFLRLINKRAPPPPNVASAMERILYQRSVRSVSYCNMRKLYMLGKFKSGGKSANQLIGVPQRIMPSVFMPDRVN